ncbi:FKBP-type peptidyl-prolyl cis-trans isomerase family protein [Orientia chuto str. Dubai]|uniref:FKBP-type peptidyl-prolyl cis-trans isomerase family protein n=1 Tax=Orientia chuto str. Dubai TaxID=1359168 RepID=A0A0F3MLW5_9RICK|nr:hypothetical protein [Candidatus Orientia mediorientalis]KJV55569.1 FKBP-type peptidyl-prolyl cis-trans isomerase family protein [Orientia chuto str. Dubai]
MQKIINIITIGAIIYVLVTGKFLDFLQTADINNSNNAVDNPVTEASSKEPEFNELEGNFFEKSLSKVLINVLKTETGRQLFKNLVHPVDQKNNLAFSNNTKINNVALINYMFDIQDVTQLPEAKGPAYCGQTVTISYRISDENDAIIEEKVKTLQLGGSKKVNSIDNITIGMRVGEVREAIVPQQYLTDISTQSNSKAFKVQITLQDIVSLTDIEKNEIRIWDDELVPYKVPYLCGHLATFDVKISKLDGTIIYDTTNEEQKIAMHLGDDNYPMIFSYALFDKIPAGKRTVLTKGKYFKNILENKNIKLFKNLQLPADEFFILELLNFQEGNNVQ